jgi:uncharacterized protein (DUF488 family)
MLQDTLWFAVLLTIGHSNHPIERFIELVEGEGVRLLADIRRYPRSRRNPCFNSDSLEQALAARGIAYWHFPALGGMRQPADDSPNTAILDSRLRGYADHMSTKAFQVALTELLDLSAAQPVAAMCAEADPRDCHRSFLADAALARGRGVTHLLPSGAKRPHELSPLASIEGESVTYPGLW